MPCLLEREKLFGLKFLDLGVVRDIRKIAERLKILSLNRRVEAYVRQSFHRHRCLSRFNAGQIPFLDSLICLFALHAMNQLMGRSDGRILRRSQAALCPPWASGRILEFKRRLPT